MLKFFLSYEKSKPPKGTHFHRLPVGSQVCSLHIFIVYLLTTASQFLATTSPITLLLLRTCLLNRLQMGERFQEILSGKVFGGRKKKHIMFIHVFMYVCIYLHICWSSGQHLKKIRRIHITITELKQWSISLDGARASQSVVVLLLLAVTSPLLYSFLSALPLQTFVFTNLDLFYLVHEMYCILLLFSESNLWRNWDTFPHLRIFCGTTSHLKQ